MLWPAPLLLLCLPLISAAFDGYAVPDLSPGFQFGNSTKQVQFDTHSLLIGGKRTFIWSGEFHPWRLPVPQLWSDIFQKMKAAGFNTVSTYMHWGLVEGSVHKLDWGHYRSIELFYEIAQREGLFVIVRPGPYINAETTGGGFPGWLTNVNATARSNDPGFMNAWGDYIAQFATITSKFQYPNGPVIAIQSENEFYVSQEINPTATEAMTQLETALRFNGINEVPITCNDVYPAGNFASGPGRVDLYGFDAYPGGFDCNHPEVMAELPNYFVSGHVTASPWSPLYLAEFQGGALDAWQGPGYDKCEALLGPEFFNVFYKNNIASGSTMMSLYMIYGGTNWGNLAHPGVYTSYDYAAAIRESRVLSPKYSELKLQGLFYHASPSLLTASYVTSGAGAPFTGNSGVFTTVLNSGNGTGTNYYVLRQMSNNVTTPTTTTLTVTTKNGNITIPRFGGHITLAGRESKILVSEYAFGNSTLHYSTAEVMTQLTIDNVDYIVLYVQRGQSLEASITPSNFTSPSVKGSSGISTEVDGSQVVITGSPSGTSVVRTGNTVAIIVDKATAGSFWQPRLSSTFDMSPSTKSILVSGPYLARNATIASSTLHLTGDTNGTTAMTIFAPASVRSLTWNGANVKVSQSNLGLGLQANINVVAQTPKLPNLKTASWKSVDSLPETSVDFNDSTWRVANKTTTSRPMKPIDGKFVLYADEYGYHSGNLIFRGHFSGGAQGVNLTVQGGSSFGFSAFLNDQFLGSGQGFFGADTVNSSLTFPSGSVTNGKNVLTIVMDSMGLDEDWDSNDAFKNPRGIRGYKLLGGGDFDSWTVHGNFNGESFPDTVRGPYNEGGLWAERCGAHLAGFDDSSWETFSPFIGISNAGIQAYRTTFTLNVADGVDASLALQFTATPSSNYRSVIYINGWQFGRFISNFGPQTTFPIPEGILNHHGSNVLFVTLWSLDAQGAKVADLKLVSLGTFASGKEVVSGGLVSSPTFQQLRN